METQNQVAVEHDEYLRGIATFTTDYQIYYGLIEKQPFLDTVNKSFRGRDRGYSQLNAYISVIYMARQ